MAVTQETVNRWIYVGKNKGAEYLISMCDTFDYDDYPVYVMPGEDLQIAKENACTSMQSMNEVIDLRPSPFDENDDTDDPIGAIAKTDPFTTRLDPFVDSVKSNRYNPIDDSNLKINISDPNTVIKKLTLKEAIEKVAEDIDNMSAKELVAEINKAKEDPRYESLLHMFIEYM